jgi:FAD synthetase
MASAAEETSTMESSNWRVIPPQSEDYSAQLVGRGSWSEAQFEDSLLLYDRLMSCTDSYVNPGIKAALNTLDHAYRLYGPQSVICSFNGGKDAVVILHLVRAAHAKHYNATGETTPPRPRVVYFDHEDEFPEIISFLQESVDVHGLDMVAFEKGVKFADGLKILVDYNIVPGSSKPFPMAFVLGTRSSDPNAEGQDHFTPSSHWMPPFMRVNPVLDWNYGHVWHFLRLFQLPYCSLYDQGYTSLGITKDTLPCPALAVHTGDKDDDGDTSSELPKFWPAYMLRDWEQERAGRIKKEKPGESKKTLKTKVSDLSIATQLKQSESIVSDGSTTVQSESVQMSETDNFTLGSESGEQKTVGLLIIGDEILKGLTLDQNTHAAAIALRKECVKLARVVVVSDDLDEIVKDIERLQTEVDVIITSGGVGPTHDDVTMKSVAASLKREMVLHEGMAELLKRKMNNGTDSPLTPAQTKMSTLPSNTKLRFLPEDDWPVLQCRNIFILPGVPQFFAEKIVNVAAYLSSQLERSAAYKVVLSVDEQSIVDILNEAVQKHPNVTFGSYPFVSHPEYKTVLTLEGSLVDSADNIDEAPPTTSLTSRNSRCFDANDMIIPKDVRDRYVRLALDDLITQLPEGSILRVENDDLTPFT